MLSFLAPEHKHHSLVMVILIYSVVFVFMPPPMEHYFSKYRQKEELHPWKAISENINGTYRSENYAPHLHEAKLTYRLVPAFIGKVVLSQDRYVQVFFLYCVQLIMGLMFTSLLYEWLLSVHGAARNAALLTLGFMLTHVGASFTYDLSFFFDGMAFFFLALAMFSDRSGGYLLGILAALWTDERAVMGIAGVLLFKLLTGEALSSFRSILLNRFTIKTVIGIASYLLVRGYMTVFLGLSVPVGNHAGVGFAEFAKNAKDIPIAWFLTFKLYWYYLIPLLAYLFRRLPAFGFFCGFFIVVGMLSTGLVIDVMRSTTYLFPFLICGLFCTTRWSGSGDQQFIGRINALWSVVIPNYRALEDFYLIIPLPFRILYHLL